MSGRCEGAARTGWKIEEMCTRGDSNSHGFPHTHLKRARLPFRHECRLFTIVGAAALSLKIHGGKRGGAIQKRVAPREGMGYIDLMAVAQFVPGALSVRERYAGLLYGALAGDALSLAAHWVYDQDELAERWGEAVDFQAPAGDGYHAGK